MANKTLFDLTAGDVFSWKGSIYRFTGILEGRGEVVCIARHDANGKLYIVTSQKENFNPYAEVELGELIWQPME